MPTQDDKQDHSYSTLLEAALNAKTEPVMLAPTPQSPVYQGEKWEYLGVEVSHRVNGGGYRIWDADSRKERSSQRLGDLLNAYGALGWELVAIVPLSWEPSALSKQPYTSYAGGGEGVHFTATFKRRKS